MATSSESPAVPIILDTDLTNFQIWLDESPSFKYSLLTSADGRCKVNKVIAYIIKWYRKGLTPDDVGVLLTGLGGKYSDVWKVYKSPVPNYKNLKNLKSILASFDDRICSGDSEKVYDAINSVASNIFGHESSKIIRAQMGRLAKELPQYHTSLQLWSNHQRNLYVGHAAKSEYMRELGILVDPLEPVTLESLCNRAGVKVYILPQPHTIPTGAINSEIIDDSLPKEWTSCSRMKYGPKHEVIHVGGDGWIIIEPNEDAVIFICDTNGKKHVHMIVLRNAVTDKTLLASMNDVVVEATGGRRNVRPTHFGSMVQFGLNCGPQHLRAFQHVNNILHKKSLKDDKILELNMQFMGVSSFIWNLFRSKMPREVVKEQDDALTQSGMPPISTRDIDEGTGYELKTKGKIWRFPLASRTPPEVYFTADYGSPIHRDTTYTPYSYGFTHDLEDEDDDAGELGRRVQTRGTTASKDVKPHGGDYVCLESHVIVRCATGTLTAFRPSSPHGTTRPYHRHTNGQCVSSTLRIQEAYQAALQSAEGVATEMILLDDI